MNLTATDQESETLISDFKSILEMGWNLRHAFMMPAGFPGVDIIVPMKSSDGILGFLKIQVKARGPEKMFKHHPGVGPVSQKRKQKSEGKFKNCVSFQVSGIPSVSIGVCRELPFDLSTIDNSDISHNRNQLGLKDVSTLDYESVFYMSLEGFTKLSKFLDALYINNNWYESIQLYH
ncbi:hypothetical protein GEMRC1_013826 [Eukaryota sp. GEM-RC1]